MPINTVKALTERIGEKVKELRGMQTAIQDGSATEEVRTKFDEGMAAIEQMKGDLARAKKFEDFSSAHGEDRTDGLTPDELNDLTDGEKRSDKIDPVLNPDAKGYRMGKVIDAMMNGRAIDGVEAEVAQELEKRNGKSAKGIMVPLTLEVRSLSGQLSHQMARQNGIDREYRELNAATTGTAALPTRLSGNMIDLLRNTAILPRAGVTVLSGLEGTFEMPKVDGAPVFSWGGESFAPAESTGTINSKVTFTPKTLAGRSRLTRRFIKQSLHSLDAEAWVRNMLMLYHALGLDFAGLAGTGVGQEPLGIFNNVNVNQISMGTNGGALTFGKTVDMETAVADANAEMLGEGCYITNARVRGQAKQSLKFPAAGSATIWENGEINGHSAKMSNQIRKDYTKGTGTNLSGFAYGIFQNLVIGLWSGADMLVDPYTGGAQGDYNVYLHQEADVQTLHDEAFAVATDVDAQIA